MKLTDARAAKESVTARKSVWWITGKFTNHIANNSLKIRVQKWEQLDAENLKVNTGRFNMIGVLTGLVNETPLLNFVF